MKNKIGKGLTALVLASGLTGCGTTMMNDIAGNSVIQGLALQGASTYMDAKIRNSVEGPRGTTVNVYGNGNNSELYRGYPLSSYRPSKFPNVLECPDGGLIPAPGWTWVNVKRTYKVVPIGN